MPTADRATAQTAVSRSVGGYRGRWSWPLLSQPPALVAYLLAVTGCDLALIGWEAGRTVMRPGQLLLFAALMACGAACIEGTRRLGMPAGVSRDLLSAWWLPVALLLPPLYALIAPIPLTALLQLRVRRAVVFRRVFSAAALGLAGAAASATFRFGSGVAGGEPLTEPRVWLSHAAIVPTAVAAAILFSLLNATLVAVAAYLADRETRWRDVLWDRERLLLDVVELCVGVLVTIACLASPVLLLVALPPVIVLQRSLLHKQLRAAARTDAKTGLLNATAWQREADNEVSRALRSGEPLALLVLDVDHFKRVNDTHGHLVGDRVLAALAVTLRQQLRDRDIVGRFGGEEFVALLPEAAAGEAYRIAERVRIRVSRTAVPAGAGDNGGPGAGAAAAAPAVAGAVTVRGNGTGLNGNGGAGHGHEVAVSVTISIGISTLGAHGRDMFELLAAADLALYRAKESGRDRVCVFAHADGGPGVPGDWPPGSALAAAEPD